MTADERRHIEAFIEAFVLRGHREGWRNALLEKPTKAAQRLRTFERQLDERFCALVDDTDAMLGALSASSSVSRVCYFDPAVRGAFLSLDDAFDRWEESGSDAIISFIPGRVAAFLFHEGWGWRCER